LKAAIHSDVLILGCGIAGGTAALELADAGLDVVIATRAQEPSESNTYWAQGGIIFRGEGDSPELLVQDVLHAGAGICREQAVELLARTGPDLVQSVLIDRLRVPFDRRSDGALSLGREGGHSLARIVHATDATGRAIEDALIAELNRHPRVRFLTGHTAVDLLTPAHHGRDRRAVYDPVSCVGAYMLDQATNEVIRCFARATILATGGLGQIFLRTTNPQGSRGDGLAMAYRAGARVINTEYVQFHPTAFYHRNAPCFLITEAVRGAGARLVDERRRPFMDRYDPEWKDLAPRDVVSRSIHAEMLARGVKNVYLDLASYIPAERIRAEFPGMYQSCLEYGIDITRDLLPVVPAAHYSCGGVWVDQNGRSTLDRLYAIGEVSCTGVHGANRPGTSPKVSSLGARRSSTTSRRGSPPAQRRPIPRWSRRT
jgi:L-aspartate oxidase